MLVEPGELPKGRMNMHRSASHFIRGFLLLVLFWMFLCPICLMGKEAPEQYREKFSESFPIRKQQHLELKDYVDRLITEQKER